MEIASILIALLILSYQLRIEAKSRSENTKSNIKIAEEKHKENELVKTRMYLEHILPKQKELRTKIKNLRNCYANYDRNLHLQRVIDSGIKFDDYQPEHIFHGRALKELKFKTEIYDEFKEILPEVKNIFPNSYTYYWNFILTLSPIYLHTAEEKPSYDGGKWVDRHVESCDLLDKFIESTYNNDSELRNVWKN